MSYGTWSVATWIEPHHNTWGKSLNTLRPRPNGRHFADDIFKCIFLNENVCIPIKISMKFVPKGPINNIPALVQIMAWRRPGDKPLSEPMMVSLTTHICVTRPQWVNIIKISYDSDNGHHTTNFFAKTISSTRIKRISLITAIKLFVSSQRYWRLVYQFAIE